MLSEFRLKLTSGHTGYTHSLPAAEADGEKTIRRVTLGNVQIEIDKWSKWPGGKHDRRPMDGEEHGGLQEAPTNGVYVDHAEDVHLRNVDVIWGNNQQAYWEDDVAGKDVINFTTA